MKILRAYADTDAMGRQGFNPAPAERPDETSRREKGRTVRGGDKISLSEEARQALETGGQEATTICPQDATYDQHGNLTRQFESLQNDLRGLAARILRTPGAQGMYANLGALQAQAASLKATA